MELAIAYINRIYDITAKIEQLGDENNESVVKVRLPQMVVLGNQSTGKSSVLERLAGHDLLPRGPDIVTRTPLRIRMIRRPKSDFRRQKQNAPEDQDYVVFDDDDTVYTDFEEVRKQIMILTNRKTGKKQVSDEEIGLSIYSDNVTDLTLVDLPGVIEKANDDQDSDLPQQINQVVDNIILAIATAVDDIGNSKAISMAHSVDPERNRTIAVITKLDMVDRGTNAMKLLTGAHMSFKLGIIGVVNRSEADRNKTMEDVEKSEKSFFKEHYPTIASQHGCRFLATTLSKLLIRHAKASLPELNDHIRNNILHYKECLDNLGEECTEQQEEIMDQIIFKFYEAYKSRTKVGDGINFDPNNVEISTASQISKIFHSNYMIKINSIEALEGFTREDKLQIVESMIGLGPHLFIRPETFVKFMQKEVVKLLNPSMLCADCVYDKLVEAIDISDSSHVFMRFPLIHEFFKDVITKFLEEQLNSVNSYIKTLIASQESYANTKAWAFQKEYDEFEKDLWNFSKQKKLRSATNLSTENLNELLDQTSGNSSENSTGNMEKVEYNTGVDRLDHLIPFYFNLVRTSVADTVMKTIVYSLIDCLHNEMVTLLQKKYRQHNSPSTLFEESASVVEARLRYKKALEYFHEARETIEKINIGMKIDD